MIELVRILAGDVRERDRGETCRGSKIEADHDSSGVPCELRAIFTGRCTARNARASTRSRGLARGFSIPRAPALSINPKASTAAQSSNNRALVLRAGQLPRRALAFVLLQVPLADADRLWRHFNE